MSQIMRHMLTIKGLCSFLTGCFGKHVVEGGLYSIRAEKGVYRVLKILKIDSIGVHIRSYSNWYDQAPDKIDESTLYMVGVDRKPEEALGSGHLPISRMSFARWGARFVQQSTVTEGELDGYRIWLENEGGYF